MQASGGSRDTAAVILTLALDSGVGSRADLEILEKNKFYCPVVTFDGREGGA